MNTVHTIVKPKILFKIHFRDYTCVYIASSVQKENTAFSAVENFYQRAQSSCWSAIKEGKKNVHRYNNTRHHWSYRDNSIVAKFEFKDPGIRDYCLGYCIRRFTNVNSRGPETVSTGKSRMMHKFRSPQPET